MRIARSATTLAALVLLAPMGLAQTQDAAAPQQPAPPPTKPFIPPPPPARPPAPAPTPVYPPFARLAELGPDGKIKRVDGILDVLAIQRNSLVDQATRDKIRPMVKAWIADVDQLAIDNLDFLERIEPADGSPGVVATSDIQDQKALHYVAQMMTQLMSAGPLSAHLEQKEGFTREQSSLNQQISSDYLQQVMNEIMAEHGVPNDLSKKSEMSEREKVEQVNAVSRFLWDISCRDAMVSFHRQLATDAQYMDQVLAKMTLTDEQKAKAKPGLAACKTAQTNDDKRKATRMVFDALTFDQRREALNRARDMAPPYDPIAELGPPIPPPANAGQPLTPAGSAPAAAAPAAYTPQPTADSKGGK